MDPMNEQSLEMRFHKVARRWRDGVAHHSLWHCMVRHKAYEELKAMGRDIIPFLLNKLKRDKWIGLSFSAKSPGSGPTTNQRRSAKDGSNLGRTISSPGMSRR